MRPPLTLQSTFHYPLSHLLAGEAATRVLRVLSRHGGELAPARIAHEAGVTLQTVRRTLERAASLGVAERVGSGRYPSYRLVAGHGFRAAIDQLFAAEATRVTDVYDALRSAAARVTPTPIAMWVYGSVARGEDQAESDLDVAVIAPNDAVEQVVDTLRDAVTPVVDRHHVRLSLVGLSPEDIARLNTRERFWRTLERDAFPLVGPTPTALRARLRPAPRRRRGAR
jgi:hypothetical protein